MLTCLEVLRKCHPLLRDPSLKPHVRRLVDELTQSLDVAQDGEEGGHKKTGLGEGSWRKIPKFPNCRILTRTLLRSCLVSAPQGCETV